MQKLFCSVGRLYNIIALRSCFHSAQRFQAPMGSAEPSSFYMCMHWEMPRTSADMIRLGCFSTPVGESWAKHCLSAGYIGCKMQERREVYAD